MYNLFRSQVKELRLNSANKLTARNKESRAKLFVSMSDTQFKAGLK